MYALDCQGAQALEKVVFEDYVILEDSLFHRVGCQIRVVYRKLVDAPLQIHQVDLIQQGASRINNFMILRQRLHHFETPAFQ